MTLAISTSSPLISVAVYSDNGVHFSKSEMANQNASGLVANWVSEAVPDFGVINRLVVDIGPGGFTGVKIGVTMAKMFALVHQIKLYSITSFDLISPNSNVAIPYKRGHFCIRNVGEQPAVSSDVRAGSYLGYGIEGIPDKYPTLDRDEIEGSLKLVDADKLVPLYVAEPSISIPKTPFAAL